MTTDHSASHLTAVSIIRPPAGLRHCGGGSVSHRPRPRRRRPRPRRHRCRHPSAGPAGRRRSPSCPVVRIRGTGDRLVESSSTLAPVHRNRVSTVSLISPRRDPAPTSVLRCRGYSHPLQQGLPAFLLVLPGFGIRPVDWNRFRFRSKTLELTPIQTPVEDGHTESIPIPVN